MSYNPTIHHRGSIRLKGYDYSSYGLYFITLVINDRLKLLGKISESQMELTPAGLQVEQEWIDLENRFTNISLHDFVVMPNHFHAIVEIDPDKSFTTANNSLGDHRPSKVMVGNKTIGAMVGAFKSIVTVKYISKVKTEYWPRFKGELWQRDYYESIIRTEEAYHNISRYIRENPKKWENT